MKNTKLITRWTFRFLGLTLVAACSLGTPATAQTGRPQTFTCGSRNGQRTYCSTQIWPGDVRVSRQISGVRCIEGYTWGHDDAGVWVDRGCRAQFQLTPVERQISERQISERPTRIAQGTTLAIRTNETIRADRSDGRIFTGVVDQDVPGDQGYPAIPRGSNVELIVRVAGDNDLILDLESVMVNGERYAIDSAPERVDSGAGNKDGLGANNRTGKFVGGGAVLGAIIGAIAGGGKGAAIGAGAGGAAGAIGQVSTRGRQLRIPAESLITFRLDRPLTMGMRDYGTQSNRYHLHPADRY